MALKSFPCDQYLTAAAPQTAPCARASERWILAATILASSMAFIDSTVVNVALPALQRALGATLSDSQWIVEAYELMLAAFLLVGGAAGDRFGRRRMFLLGVIIFVIGSIACGLSDRASLLIIARGVQGAGGALLIPLSLALLSASFDDERRGRAIGIWSGFTAIAAAVGPVLGGFLIDHASWRYAFFINVPLAVIVVVLTLRHISESIVDPRNKSIDWLGAVLAALGMGGVIYGLIAAQTAGWSDGAVIGALVIGVVAVVAFMLVESRQSAPMLPLHLFRSFDFSGANLLTLLLYGALAGSLFFLPLDLVQVQGYSTAAAGAALLPLVVLMFALSPWAGGLVDRYGARLPLVVGPAVVACGFALFALLGNAGSYWTSVFPAALVLGFGMTVTVAPLTTVVMQAVSANAVGIASGINNAISSVGGLLAIAGLGMVMSHTFNVDVHQQLVAAKASAAIVHDVESQRARLAAIEVASSATAEERSAVQRAIGSAFAAGFRRVMWIASLLAFASAVVALLMIGRNARDSANDTSGGPADRDTRET